MNLLNPELEKNWKQLIKQLSKRFGDGEELNLQGVLFLIGVQELGKGRQNFSKDQKVDLMHIAICRLLSRYGYYEYEGKDKDGWPHWKINEKLPYLKPGQQMQIVKQSIIEYFTQ